jgi:signal peptidase I
VATSLPDRLPLQAELGARRSREQAAQQRRLQWLDLATSLWSPITVLAMALIPYMVVIESAPRTAPRALPLMQGFGLLMVAWFFGLLLWRQVDRRGSALRKLRHEARELTDEVGTGLASIHDAADRQRLVEQAARVDAATAANQAPALEKELKALSEQAARTVPSFRKGGMVAIGIGFAKALAVAFAIRALFIEPFRIPSGSMIPTLEIGDQIFVNKFIYGVRIPILNKVFFTIVRPPERGDVIVFNNPVRTEDDFIKRVVGIPGDVVEFHNDILYVNGRVVPGRQLSRRVETWDHPEGGSWHAEYPELWTENLGGKEHLVLQQPGRRPDANPDAPIRVPEHMVFVMGDNRDNSTDSRFGLGGPNRGVVFVPYDSIKGKAMIIWLSFSHGGLGSTLFGGTGLRTERFFRQVR